MNARDWHDHFVANGPQALQPFSRKLLRDFKVMTVNSEEHQDQKRNQNYHDPRAMHELGEDENHQHHKGGNRADAIYHQILFPMRFPLELLDLSHGPGCFSHQASRLEFPGKLIC